MKITSNLEGHANILFLIGYLGVCKLKLKPNYFTQTFCEIMLFECINIMIWTLTLKIQSFILFSMID